MKKMLFLLMLATAPIGAMAADTYKSLVFQRSDGTKVSVTATGTKITFSGTNAVITNGTTTETIALSSLSTMYFSTDEATAIREVTAGTGTDGPVEIYTLGGVRVDRMDKPGVYIVKKNGKTFKQVIK